MRKVIMELSTNAIAWNPMEAPTFIGEAIFYLKSHQQMAIIYLLPECFPYEPTWYPLKITVAPIDLTRPEKSNFSAF